MPMAASWAILTVMADKDTQISRQGSYSQVNDLLNGYGHCA